MIGSQLDGWEPAEVEEGRRKESKTSSFVASRVVKASIDDDEEDCIDHSFLAGIHHDFDFLSYTTAPQLRSRRLDTFSEIQ